MSDFMDRTLGLDFGTVGSSAVLGGILLAMIGLAYYYNNRNQRQALAELS